VAIAAFTQAQVNAGHVRFVHNGSEAAPSYDVTVSDGSLSDGPKAASITFTSVNAVPPAVRPSNGAGDDTAPNPNPPAVGTTQTPSPEIIAAGPQPKTPSEQDGLLSKVMPAVFVSYGHSTAPSQEAKTDRGQGEMASSTPDGSEPGPQGQATAGTDAASGPTQGEATRTEASLDMAAMIRGALVPGITVAQTTAPRMALTGPIAMGLQEPPRAATQDELAELPGSDESRVEVLEKTLHASGLVGELNRLHDDVAQKGKIEQTVIGSTVALTTGLSVGYVVWLLRGGLLLSSLLSSLPAWHVIDPWPVLSRVKRSEEEQEDDASDDPLERMFDKAKTLVARLRKTKPGAVAHPKAVASPSAPEDDSTAAEG
jgi:hypothetical protein